jgi:hypothetical protein
MGAWFIYQYCAGEVSRHAWESALLAPEAAKALWVVWSLVLKTVTGVIVVNHSRRDAAGSDQLLPTCWLCTAFDGAFGAEWATVG